MSQRLSLPISKHILNLYHEDWLFLMKRFGPDGHHNVGVAHVIRECVHKLVLRTRQAEADEADALRARPAGSEHLEMKDE
jgi:sirohydrochlorin ferrochelatase